MSKNDDLINLKEIAESAWGINQNITEEGLALLFLESIAKVKSVFDFIQLLNIFLNPRCKLKNELIINVIFNIGTYNLVEIHNHPNASKPRTRLEDIISYMSKNPTTSKGGIHRDII